MSRRYTAEDMRKVAKSLLSSEVNLDFDKRDIASMLKQSADELEREKKCQYQYAARYFYPSGIIATDHIFDNPTDAKCFSGSIDGVKKIICRRKVGEWEEVE